MSGEAVTVDTQGMEDDSDVHENRPQNDEVTVDILLIEEEEKE